MTLRPERPSSAPDSTRGRIKQIHIPLIFPPSSPRQPYTPNQSEHPNNNRRIPPSSPQQPVAPVRPVVETGEAGPPGYMRRVTVRRGSEDSSSRMPVTGFAGMPGEEPSSCTQISMENSSSALPYRLYNHFIPLEGVSRYCTIHMNIIRI